MQAKLEREKTALQNQYSRLRKTVEETETQKMNLELENFKREQNKLLGSKKVDIDKLKAEKRQIQQEYSQKLEDYRVQAE